ncbi:dihydrofolate reductase family protein [Cryptosporangium sp. NPDC051539]|uniref:dihydrofolate reductase family protein n=1 Tax=Cryptosporangium sp. NPDC051539 TaxID=3363962 RepID=UPI003790D2F2
MGAVIVDLTVSLDGFIAGADDGLESPLGRGGEPLFAWMTSGPRDPDDPRLSVVGPSRPIVDEWRSRAGAILSGRRTFDIARGWAGGHPIDAPIFVLTHAAPTSGEWSPRVRFATDGFDAALADAREAAGDGVISLCGADLAQQALRAGVLDEIQVSVVPLLLGSGVRLLDGIGPITLEQTRVIPSDGVTHLRYRVLR